MGQMIRLYSGDTQPTRLPTTTACHPFSAVATYGQVVPGASWVIRPYVRPFPSRMLTLPPSETMITVPETGVSSASGGSGCAGWLSFPHHQAAWFFVPSTPASASAPERHLGFAPNSRPRRSAHTSDSSFLQGRVIKTPFERPSARLPSGFPRAFIVCSSQDLKRQSRKGRRHCLPRLATCLIPQLSASSSTFFAVSATGHALSQRRIDRERRCRLSAPRLHSSLHR